MGAAKRTWMVVALVILVWGGSQKRAHAQLGALVSPGPLSNAHASLEGIAKCLSCHQQGNRVTPAKCLACHTPVAERIAAKTGVHRAVTGDCVSCHAEHAGRDAELRPFDTKTFDHHVTRFPVDGLHAALADGCSACHKTRSYLTVSTSCASCHTDVHKGSLGASCRTCHSTSAPFKDVGRQFDHSKAAFPLVGAHRATACAGCHSKGVYRGVKFASCTDCHKDPHVQKLGTTCTACHTNDSWRTRTISHGKTAFPLVGKHAQVVCQACHKQSALKVRLKADTCVSCHADVHRGTFKQDCAACHTVSSWQQAPFDHSRTRFPLTARHQGLTCVKCHTNVSVAAKAVNRNIDFRGLGTACSGCHTDVHRGELDANCETCHSAATFRVPTFTHGSAPEFFAGEHTAVACDRCHVPAPPLQPVRTAAAVMVVRYRNTPTRCVDCHKDVHLGQEGALCETCHDVHTPKFAVTSFAHDTKTAFVLAGAHAAVACVDCHKVETGAFPSESGTARRLKGLAKDCAGCHADVHLGQVGDRCETCHTAESFKLRHFMHRATKTTVSFFVGRHVKASCDSCHQSATRAFPKGRGTAVVFAVDRACVTCHVDKHRGALGPDCASCHRP